MLLQLEEDVGKVRVCDREHTTWDVQVRTWDEFPQTILHHGLREVLGEEANVESGRGDNDLWELENRLFARK